MTHTWPAPNDDEADGGSGDDRHPNYAIRRLAVGIALIAVIAAITYVVASRRDGGDSDSGSSAPRWNTVVTQNPSGTITLFDREGSEVSTIDTDLRGLGDVGVVGTVLVGTEGDVSTDGIGLVDLQTGTIQTLRLRTDLQGGFDGQPFRVGYDASTQAIELVDVRRAEVVDLLEFSAADSPVVLPESVHVDPTGDHVAFTELTRAETILVDLETATAVSMPGTLADMAFDSVITVTNRGDTVLLDRYGFDGKRTGTVETIIPAAVMLVGDTGALVVGQDGSIVRVDFAQESTADAGNVTPEALVDTSADDTDSTDSTDSSDGAGDATDVAASSVLQQGVALVEHTRLMVFGDGFVTVVGNSGDVIGSVETASNVTPTGAAGFDQRCLLVSDGARLNMLIDAQSATTSDNFRTGAATGRSADGCTIAYEEVDRDGALVIGPDLDLELDGKVHAMSSDASAVLQVDSSGIAVVLLDNVVVLPLTDERGVALFAAR
jgi:hypothetical protein